MMIIKSILFLFELTTSLLRGPAHTANRSTALILAGSCEFGFMIIAQ